MFYKDEQLTLGEQVCNHKNKENKRLLVVAAVCGTVIRGVIRDRVKTVTESTET